MKNKCYFCASDEIHTNIETHKDKEITYVLNECVVCGVQYWTPFKNPGSDWYEHDERYKGANEDPVIATTWSQRKVLEFLRPLTGKVFDIGCGTGNFLYLAKGKGWEVSGIDFDNNAIYTAQTWFSLPNIELKTLEEYTNNSANNNRYNLVTFFDVFEHIDNHLEFTKQIKTLLVSRGYAAMSMPYRNGSRWLQPNDLPPRHLTKWDRKALSKFFERNGFSVMYIKRVPTNFFGIIMKLRFKYGKFVSFGLVKKVQNEKKKDSKNSQNKIEEKFSGKIKIIHTLAKLKDVVIFGIPALFVWIYFWITGGIYTSLFAIVRKVD